MRSMPVAAGETGRLVSVANEGAEPHKGRSKWVSAIVGTTIVLAQLQIGFAAATASLAAGCGPNAPRAAAAPRETPAQWQDVFDATPDVYVVVRPQLIKRDRVYGNLWKALMRLAQARSEMRGVTSVEAMEGAEEIVFGLRRDERGGEDAWMILRGVPASLDVARMTDTAGRPLLRLVDAKAKVGEYEAAGRGLRPESGADPRASLFVLPDRTWVGVTGDDARAQARQAFATPFGRPIPKSDPEALATARFDAAAFLSTPRFQKGSAFGALTKKLRSLTLALKAGKGGILATLQYEDEDQAALTELRIKELVEDLGKPENQGRLKLDWLKPAQVAHDGNKVLVTLPVPPRLLQELPNASAADLPF